MSLGFIYGLFSWTFFWIVLCLATAIVGLILHHRDQSALAQLSSMLAQESSCANAFRVRETILGKLRRDEMADALDRIHDDLVNGRDVIRVTANGKPFNITVNHE